MRDAPYWNYWAQLPWYDPKRDTCEGGNPCRHCHATPVFLKADEPLGARDRVASLCLHCGEGLPNPRWIEKGWRVGVDQREQMT